MLALFKKMSRNFFPIVLMFLLLSKSETACDSSWKTHITMNIFYIRECRFNSENSILKSINTERSRCSEACYKNQACTHYFWVDGNCSLRKDYVSSRKEVVCIKSNSECGIVENRNGKKKIKNKYALIALIYFIIIFIASLSTSKSTTLENLVLTTTTFFSFNSTATGTLFNEKNLSNQTLTKLTPVLKSTAPKKILANELIYLYIILGLIFKLIYI